MLYHSFLCTDKHISIATLADVAALLLLLNGAYRGESSKKGWTNEAHLIDGDVRTDQVSLKEVLEKSESVLLKYENDNRNIIGCVNLQRYKNDIYLGMLAVNPMEQGNGIGKKLLKAAEEYTLNAHCHSIHMTVISVRTELIDWYKRNGYIDTCVRKPFIEDGRSGRHLQQLEFTVLKKVLKTNK